MKKIAILLVLFLTGCTDLSNTPTKKTEEFLKKYQTLDNSVISDLNNVVDQEETFTESQKDKYKDIMKKHYQNMTYKIKEEEIDGDKAEVTVEIKVTDFRYALQDANIYLNEHPEEFNDDKGNYDPSKYIDYRLQKLNETKDTVTYTIELQLTKVDETWKVDTPDVETLDKINGIYNY